MKKRWVFRVVIYVMIISMLLSTLIFAIDAII